VTRAVLRWVMALFYASAGIAHLVIPQPFLTITPEWVPQPALVVLLTGLAELAGAAGLAQPWSPALRRAAGWGLAAYALCVWPANFNHMLIDLARSDGAAGLGYHIPRLLFQPVLIWLAWWASRDPRRA
jgi:uncharacterized membrane protein